MEICNKENLKKFGNCLIKIKKYEIRRTRNTHGRQVLKKIALSGIFHGTRTTENVAEV